MQNANRISGQPTLHGDVLFDRGKFEKFIKVARLGVGGTTAGASETATAFLFPAQGLVYDAFVNVITPVISTSAGAIEINLGLLAASSGGNASGFLAGLAVNSSGVKAPTLTAATSGINTGTYGAFLATNQGTATTTAIPMAIQKTFILDSVAAKTLSWTPSTSSSGWSLVKIDVYVAFVDITI